MAGKDRKIWLSHSGLDVLYRCPRCFWLKYREGIYQPEGIVSRLPGRFDIVVKRYFDFFREKGLLPPIIEGKLAGALETPFQEKYFYSIDSNYGFLGKLDECMVNPDKTYSPVDFKTASSDPRGKESFQAYQNQMDEFSFLMEVNGKKTSGQSHLIYFYPEDSDELHKGFPMLVYIQTLRTQPDSVMPRIKKGIDILEGNMPSPSQDCPFCLWHENLQTILNKN